MASLSPLPSKKLSLPTTRSRSPVPELEYQRLQRTADTISIKFEQECRRDILLDEQIRIFEEELRRKKETFLPCVEADIEEKKLRQKIAGLSHELHLTAISVAETQTRNKELKRKIESCRRDLSNCKYAISSLSSDIQQMSKEATHLNSINCAKTLAEVKGRGQMEQVRSKSVNERLKQVKKLQELKVSSRQTALREEPGDATNTFVTGVEEEVRTTARRVYDLVDPIPIQRALQHKWHDVPPTQRLLQAKFSLDSYLKHLKILQSAFKTIESATGVSNISEIVSMVIKSEEQSYNQHRQVNLLNAEAETLDEELTSAKRTISRMVESKARGEKQASFIIRNLKESLAEVRDGKRAKGAVYGRVRDSLEDSYSAVKVSDMQTMMELFASSEFQCVKKSTFSINSRITISNVLTYLAEAEESITALRAWQSYVQNSLPGVISAMTLSKMSYKRFDLTPISVKSTLADSLMEEDDIDELKIPLHEAQIRSRMKMLLEQRLDPHSGAKSVTDQRKSFRLPL